MISFTFLPKKKKLEQKKIAQKFAKACKVGDLEKIYEILEKEDMALITSVMKNSDLNPVYVAYKSGHFNVFKCLIQKGLAEYIDVEKASESLLLNHDLVVEEMLMYFLETFGTELVKLKHTLTNCLDLFVLRDLESVVELLIKMGGYPVQSTSTNHEILCYMIVKKNFAMVKFLLEKTIDTTFDWPRMAKLAVDLNCLEMTKLLLTKLSVAGMKSVFSKVCNLGKMDEAKILLGYGISVNDYDSTMDQQKLTFLQQACKGYSKHKNLHFIEFLLKNNADVHDVDKMQCTALFYSVGYPELINLLVRFGANINAQAFDGRTALHKATMKGYINTARTLIKYNANIQLRDLEGFSVFHQAVECTKDALLNLFLKHQYIDVNNHVDRWNCNLIHVLKSTVKRMEVDQNVHELCQVVNTLLHWGGDMSFLYENQKLFPNCKRNYGKFCSGINFFDKVFLLGYQASNQELKKLLEVYYKRDDNMAIQFYGEELKMLKTLVITCLPKITLFDLLLINRNDLAKVSQNRNLKKIFKECKKDFEVKFPHFGMLLNFKIRQGIARKTSMDFAIDKLQYLLAYRLPEKCSEKIFLYLNKAQLENFNKDEQNC